MGRPARRPRRLAAQSLCPGGSSAACLSPLQVLDEWPIDRAGPPRESVWVRKPFLCLTVSVALVFGASLGTGSASAQTGGGDSGSLFVSTKTVKEFIKRRARIVGLNQQPLFPNARIYKTGAFATCLRSSLGNGRRFVCGWNAYVYEESKRDPGEFEVRQSTFRYCTAGEDDDGFAAVIVRRARYSRRLRVASPWLVSCELTQSSIDSWNVFAYRDDQVWQPFRSEPLPEVPESTLPPPKPEPQELLPAPAGQPGGPPPGPLATGTEYRSTPQTSARFTTGGTGYLWRGGSWLGCTQWQRYQADPRYWVFFCFWRPPAAATLPGAALGIFTQEVVTYWEGYYWSDNDSNGRPLGTLFASGQL